LSVLTMSFTGQSRPRTSWITCSGALVEARLSHGLISGPGFLIFPRRGVEASIRRPIRSVGVITSARSWASGSRMSSRSPLVTSLDHLLDLFEFFPGRSTIVPNPPSTHWGLIELGRTDDDCTIVLSP